MVTVIQALVLGLIQGLTEFLPISSSGHLAVAQQLLGFTTPPIAFDVWVHLATLVAVVGLFYSRLWGLAKQMGLGLLSFPRITVPKLVTLLLVGTLPAVFLGLALEGFMEYLFASPIWTGIGFLVSGMVMLSIPYLSLGSIPISGMTNVNSFIIGVFQAVAIVPSISRSGATIFAALWRGLSREAAYEFSFLLSIPAILGAVVLELDSLTSLTSADFAPYAVGFVAAAVSGILALIWLKHLVIAGKIYWFGYYCLGIGILSFFL